MSEQQQPICATIPPVERERALEVRNAFLRLLRAWEDMYQLPHSVQTKREREQERWK